MKFQKKLSPSHLVLRIKICDQIRTSFPCHHLRVMKFQIRSSFCCHHLRVMKFQIRSSFCCHHLRSMRDGSNISSYLFHWNQLFPWPQSGMVSTVKALCFEVQLPKPSQELFQWAQEDSSINIVSKGETTGFPVTPHNEQLSYASPSKKRLDAISDSAKESKQSVFIMDSHTFELYTSSLNKRTSSRPKKLSRCSIHPPQSNFDKGDPVKNGIGEICYATSLQNFVESTFNALPSNQVKGRITKSYYFHRLFILLLNTME
ncbi:uncharacterized protein LOC103928746 isoform X3 [Pyrus x bretschneideri]|uniref:uncharacterized protein LOC103928746 isoform X3 n=1 Tax=Pyrus x bretschneideri TaxID=225117 RepID=UPI00203088C5|nr:uncharacterized protein LOC103928746 isoform X3 [Pyrus x bretschneideri]